MVIGTVVMVGGSLLPWVGTGGARRHSYRLFALVERLGFAPDGPAAAALRWWPLVPLIAVVAVVAAWWGWPRTGGAIGIVAGLYAGGVSLAVRAAASDVVDVAAGPTVTAVGAAVLRVGSLGCVVAGAQDAAGRVTPPTGLAASGRPAAPPADRS
jgi:hypothetical protein